MAHALRVADYVVDFLRQQGVTHFFGVGGANIEDLYDAVHRAGPPLRGIVAKHEFSAATMADGYHRASQRVAAVVATSGAGAVNLVPGLAELRSSYVPAIVLIGQPPAALDGLGSFQETSGRAGTIDAVRLFDELAVHCARVDSPHDITTALPAAYAAATDPASPGPAVLLLPKDLQQAAAPDRPPYTAAGTGVVRAGPSPVFGDAGHDHALAVLRTARDGQGVAIVAGEGVARADARRELSRLSEVLDAPVAVAPDAKDVFASTGPRGLGLLGPVSRPEARERLEQASAVLLVGTRLPHFAGAALRDHLKGVPVVTVDSRESYLHEHPELVTLAGDMRSELAWLAGQLAGRPAGAAESEELAASGVRPEPRTEVRAGDDGDPLDVRTAALTISVEIPAGATVVTDAGNAGATCMRHVRVPDDGRFITAMGMGPMGHSFGAAIGAAFGTGRPAYVLAGDGSFYTHGMELHTAVEHGLPVTVVLFNNNAHAMCHTREELFFPDDYTYNVFRPAHLGDGVAAMFPGVDAVTVRTVGELRTALSRARGRSAPSFICIDVDHTEMPPFLPFQQQAHKTTQGVSDDDG